MRATKVSGQATAGGYGSLKISEVSQLTGIGIEALSEWDAAGDIAGHICGLIEGTEIGHKLSGSKLVIRKK